MSQQIATLGDDVRRHLDATDNSGVGVNYADAVLKAIKTTLPDGRKVVGRRRGLEITLRIGERQGSALLRRLEHGPDVEAIVAAALRDAAAAAGGDLSIEADAVRLVDATPTDPAG